MNRPGAWLGARLSVLAAETAEPDRFSRGRQYLRDGAVVSLEVDTQVVRSTVQGSVAEPYRVEVRWVPSFRPGPLPRRSELQTSCSCPDPVGCCKHAVAVLLALAEAVGDEPSLLDDWRGSDDLWAHLPEAPVEAALPAGGRTGAGTAAGGMSPTLLEFFGERDPSTGHDGSGDPDWTALLAGLPVLHPAERPAPEHPVEPLLGRAVDEAASELRRLLG